MVNKKKILMAVGGTGGHLFPAMALGEELTEKYGCEVLLAGGKLSQNQFVENAKIPFCEVNCGSLTMNPLKLMKESWRLLKGVKESMDLLRSYSPDAVLGFGSFYSLPLLIACKLMRKRLFLHEGNSIPGRVNRLFAPMAEKVWVHFPGAKNYLNGNARLGGLPLREKLRKGFQTARDARKIFQLDPELLTILVLGGSQGAKKLNALFSEAVLFHLKDLLPAFQVIHAAGSHSEAELLMARYVSASIPAYVRPFIKNMESAWSAATLVVSRAGAASIAEQYAFEVPGLLVPYPYATDNHQEANADFLVSVGLAIKELQENLTPQSLSMRIQDLFIHSAEKVQAVMAYKAENALPLLSQELIGALEEK